MLNVSFWFKSIFLLSIFSIISIISSAQEKRISGNLSSAERIPLQGINVTIRGTDLGTISDIQGKFSIIVPGADAVMVVSSVGYVTQIIRLGNQTSVDLELYTDISSLNSRVATGYASQQKKEITGAVGIVNVNELTQMPQGNVTQQLQGRVAGVTVTQDSRPGQAAKVSIRGINSFKNNNPMYVVDGVPTMNVNFLNPYDIESMSVLKDAGAASIYGSRAANGVIEITTKKGEKGMHINYNMYLGTQNPGKGPSNLLNTEEYANLQWLVYDNDGTAETHPIYGRSTGSPTIPSWAAETNWYDEVTENTMIMNHELSMSAGNENANYFASFGYFHQDGTVLYDWYKRFSARFNSDYNIKDLLIIGENISVAHHSDNGLTNNGSESNTAMLGVYRSQSIIPVIWNTGSYSGSNHDYENGDWGGTGIAPRLGNGSNIVADRMRNRNDHWQNLEVLGNVFAQVKILDSLNFKTSFGGTFNNWYTTNWNGSTYENAENRYTSSYQEQSAWKADWIWTNTLTYNKSIGNHHILALGGYETIKTEIGRGVRAQRDGYFSDSYSYRTVSNGASITASDSWFNTPIHLISLFLRADYNFRSRYYLSGTVRRDGSSVFGTDTRYGTFPSITAAWRISEEPFFGNLSLISDFKIRGGYGTMGNQFVINPANQYYFYSGSATSSSYDLNGTKYSSLQGFFPTSIGNEETKWETNTTTNVGVDATIFNDKFEISIDWYKKINQDLLFTPELPAIGGGADAPAVNIGEMKNTGIDLQLLYRQAWINSNFNASIQVTSYNNEIVQIAEEYEFFETRNSRIGTINRNEVGRELGEFYGFNIIGLFQSQEEVSHAPYQDGAREGFFRFENINEDDYINYDDRKFIGNPNPDFTYSINLNYCLNNFDITAFFYGSQGNDIYNFNKWWTDFWPSFQGQKSTDLFYDSWRPWGRETSVPKASNQSNFSTNRQSTSYFVEDGSYFRLKNLQIGYTFSESFLGNIFTNARIYIQGINLFTITKYSGLDPELAHINEDFMGVDEGNLPSVRQYIIGVNLGF